MICTKNCRHGEMMYLSNDIYIGRSLDKYGESHFYEIQLLKQLVAKGDMVIDVGANVGVITVPLAQAVGEQGHVISIEAQPHLHNILCANLALNDLHQVQPLNRAVANSSGNVAYVPELDYSSESSFDCVFLSQQESPNCRPISTISIDEMNLNPRLIKIDVEGMELPVLFGSTKTIDRCRPILFVEFVADHEELMLFMKSINYEFKIHEPPLFNKNNYFHEEQNVFEGMVSTDIVCWHKDTELDVAGDFLYDLKNPIEGHKCFGKMKDRIYG